MHKLADLMERDTEALAELEALDNGKSAKIAKEVDLPDSIACLRYYAGELNFVIPHRSLIFTTSVGWADKIYGQVRSH